MLWHDPNEYVLTKQEVVWGVGKELIVSDFKEVNKCIFMFIKLQGICIVMSDFIQT